MMTLSETRIATRLAVLGVIGTVVWYTLACYGVRTLKGMGDAVNHGSPDNE